MKRSINSGSSPYKRRASLAFGTRAESPDGIGGHVETHDNDLDRK